MKRADQEALRTRASLLSRVRRGDEAGWSEFYDLHKNFIYSSARAAGLSREESEDLVQDTMACVQKHIATFVPDPNRARFRTWLFGIVRSRIVDCLRKRKRDPLQQTRSTDDTSTRDASETSTLHRLPDLGEIEVDRLIDRKWAEALHAKALPLVKALVDIDHFQAFDLLRLQKISSKEAAKILGVSAVTVRVWAFRVGREVKRQASQILRKLEQPIIV